VFVVKSLTGKLAMERGQKIFNSRGWKIVNLTLL
jgi:hypothetical protein